MGEDQDQVEEDQYLVGKDPYQLQPATENQINKEDQVLKNVDLLAEQQRKA